MRIEHLRIIADIAETGSLTATAQRKFVSQQAVSKMVKQLEKELDATLLISTRNGVTFTEVGKELVAFSQKVLQEEEDFQRHISRIKHLEQSNKRTDLHIASTSSITNLLLPILISNTKMQENNIKIHINQSKSYVDVIEQVHTKKSDLGFVTLNANELPRLMAPYQRDLEAAVLMNDKMIAVMDKRFYKGESLYVSDHDFEQYAVRTLYNTHPMDMFQDSIKDSNIICSGDADFHRNMMERAGAITLMSVTTQHMHFNNKRYVPLILGEHFNEHPLLHVAIYRKQAANQMEDLINLLRREMVFEGLKNK